MYGTDLSTGDIISDNGLYDVYGSYYLPGDTDVNWLNTPDNTSSSEQLLKTLFYVLIQVTGIPEWAFGAGMTGAWATVRQQAIPLLQKIHAKRMDVNDSMLKLCVISAKVMQLHNPDNSFDTDAEIVWDDALNRDTSEILNIIQTLLPMKLITEETALSLTGVVSDPVKELEIIKKDNKQISDDILDHAQDQLNNKVIQLINESKASGEMDLLNNILDLEYDGEVHGPHLGSRGCPGNCNNQFGISGDSVMRHHNDFNKGDVQSKEHINRGGNTFVSFEKTHVTNETGENNTKTVDKQYDEEFMREISVLIKDSEDRIALSQKINSEFDIQKYNKILNSIKQKKEEAINNAIPHVMKETGAIPDKAREYIEAVNSFTYGYDMLIRDYQQNGNIDNSYDSKKTSDSKDIVINKVKQYSDAIEEYITMAPKYRNMMYRGISIEVSTYNSFIQDIKSGTNMLGTSSWSTNMTTATNIASKLSSQLKNGTNKDYVCVILRMSNGSMNAVPIQHLSEWGKIESEVLLSNKSNVRSISEPILKKDAIAKYYIDVEEIS